MQNITPETAYAVSAVASVLLFVLGYLVGRRGRKVAKK